MSKLPEPINGTELYLAAILGELRAIRAAVEGAGVGEAIGKPAEPEVGDLDGLDAPAVSAPWLETEGEPAPAQPPTKRTRTRSR